MSVISVERKEQLENLDNFIENTRKELFSIVSALGWSIESLSKDVEDIAVCPFNENHHVPERSLERHLEECQWKAEGYSKEDIPLSIPSLPPGAASSIKFDEQLQDSVIQNAKHKNPTMAIVHYRCYTRQNGLDISFFLSLPNEPRPVGARGRLIPRTSDRLVAEFTRDERCAMYEYVIENTIEPDIGEDIADMNKPKSAGDVRKSSYLELLAQERNLKRRRAKYRGVHTNKKSQVEILREVISQQMEMLGEYISEKSDDPSRWPANELPIDDPPRDGRSDTRRYCDSGRVEYHVTSKSGTNADGKDRQRDSCKKLSEDRGFRGRSSIDHGHDRGNSDSRDRERRSNGTSDKKNYYGEHRRENSRDRRSRKSSHKSHRDRSKDRQGHKRHRSRDREKSRSSRDRKPESSRESRHDDRKRKKRKSRD